MSDDRTERCVIGPSQRVQDALNCHAYLDVYERRYQLATHTLSAAARIARRGDSALSTRHWVASVQVEAYADLGDLTSCERAWSAVMSSARPACHNVPFAGVNSGHHGHRPTVSQPHACVPFLQVKGVFGGQFLVDSQAQSASSILVTRSREKPQVSGLGLFIA